MKKKGYWDNTVLIVTTDNGGNLGGSGNNYPLRGGKYTFWEGGVKGIGFMASPLLKDAEKTYDGLISGVDWYSTIANLAGLNDKNTGNITADGVDIWQAVKNNASSPRNTIIH